MPSYSRVILMGNLTRDPEIRQSQKGNSVARAAIAVNERTQDAQGTWRDQPCFVDVVVFGQAAENFGRFFKKGRPCLVEGRLHQARWQDKQTGQNRSKLEVWVDRWYFVDTRGDAEKGSAAPAAAGAVHEVEPAAAGPEFPGPEDFVPEDVPF